MDLSLDEVFGQVVEMAEQDPDILMHYGSWFRPLSPGKRKEPQPAQRRLPLPGG